MKPDATAQFRSAPAPVERGYMGGTTIGCGQHPTTPKRHRWGPWRLVYSGTGQERTCQRCGLVSDIKWLIP